MLLRLPASSTELRKNRNDLAARPPTEKLGKLRIKLRQRLRHSLSRVTTGRFAWLRLTQANMRTVLSKKKKI